jgi:hypothetical protein
LTDFFRSWIGMDVKELKRVLP